MFAHRGASAHAPENTIDAFTLALRLGATGLESDVWATSDGIPVLDHDGEIKRGRFRKRPVGELRRDELPDHVPSLVELLEACGDSYHLSLDLKDPSVGALVVDTIADAAPDLVGRLWLCHPEVGVLSALRPHDGVVRLVHSTRLERLRDGPERHAARLAAAGIDGINMRQPDWNGGLVALFHRFELAAFSWDLQHEHQLRPAFRMGIDAVYSDHVDRMVDAYRAEVGSPL